MRKGSDKPNMRNPIWHTIGYAHPQRRSKHSTGDRVIECGVKSSSEPRSAAEIWRASLERISTLFGRLAYLASMREPGSDHYQFSALSQAVGREEADRILRRSHYQLFVQWLALSLAEQKSDLHEFLRGSVSGLEVPIREMPPANVHEVERTLYVNDLELLIELLRFERDLASDSGRSGVAHVAQG
jgi:hypothetical protein